MSKGPIPKFGESNQGHLTSKESENILIKEEKSPQRLSHDDLMYQVNHFKESIAEENQLTRPEDDDPLECPECEKMQSLIIQAKEALDDLKEEV